MGRHDERFGGVTGKPGWTDAPDPDDLPAALSYLCLVFPDEVAARLVEAFRSAPILLKEAKDVVRASGLPLLGPDDPHVAKDLRKVERGELLHPVLVVQGDARRGLPLTIADGYHRVCASHHLDVSTPIPCLLVPAPV